MQQVSHKAQSHHVTNIRYMNIFSLFNMNLLNRELKTYLKCKHIHILLKKVHWHENHLRWTNIANSLGFNESKTESKINEDRSQAIIGEITL